MRSGSGPPPLVWILPPNVDPELDQIRAEAQRLLDNEGIWTDDERVLFRSLCARELELLGHVAADAPGTIGARPRRRRGR